MSAEATAYVWHRGRLARHRIVLALAHLSKDRIAPFKASPGCSALASMLGSGHANVARSLRELVAKGVLKIESEPAPDTPASYSFR